MKEKPWYPIVYMFLVTVFFSGLLVALHAATKERVARNERLYRERAVLIALGLADEGTGEETLLERLRRVRAITRAATRADEADPFVLTIKDDNGRRRVVMEYELTGEDGKPVAYAVPVSGRGYWDVIAGFVGVWADGMTVTGIAFYQQKETPGLGAEIATPAWRSRFAPSTDRTLVLAEGAEPITILPAGTAPTGGVVSSVDGVTGATQTSVRLGAFMNAQLAAWRQRRRAAKADPPEGEDP